MHPASDFVVYPCEVCGKRIFTRRAHAGGLGTCPLCGAQHTIGGRAVIAAQPGIERRDAERVAAPGAQVAIDPARGPGAGQFETMVPQLHAVGDLSATGIAVVVPAVRDTAHLSGWRAPDVKIGDVMRLALHAPELFRPRAFKAEVRRVVPNKDKRTYTLGLTFVGLTDDQRAELGALVRRLTNP